MLTRMKVVLKKVRNSKMTLFKIYVCFSLKVTDVISLLF